MIYDCARKGAAASATRRISSSSLPMRRHLFSSRQVAANEPRPISLDLIHCIEQIGSSQEQFNPLRASKKFSMHDVGAMPRQLHAVAREIQPMAAGQHAA